MRTWFFGVAVGVILAMAGPAVAQEAINHASVAGRVTDETGGSVVDARIEAREMATGVKNAARTDAEGRFRLAYLKPGQYEFTVSAKGFADARRTLTLAIGTAFDLPVRLKPGAADAVIVTADATLIDAARSQISAVVGQQEAQSLPLNGRNFLDIALIAPGVSPTNVGGGTQLFPETSAVPGVGLSVSSQRNLSNNFMVDGLSANDDAAALSGISFSVDSIGQMQVVTSGGQAELGRAIGGYFNVATRSGTNTWHTDGYGFFRDDVLTAANRLSGTKLPLHQNQFGGSVGGPLARERTFVFGNFEHRDLDQSGLVTIAAPTVAAINARLAAVGYSGPPVTSGIYPNPVATTHALAKIDHHLQGGGQLSFRYSSYAASSENARGAGGTSAPSASAGLDSLDQTIAAAAILVLSPSSVLEARGQIAHSDLEAPPTDPLGPAVTVSGVATFGRLSTSPTGRVGTLYQAVTSVLYQKGAHSLRAGVDILHNDVTIEFPRAVNGAYVFSSLASFLAGAYNNSGFTQTFGDTSVALSNPNVGLFVQDEWRAGSHVTINAGVRYDLQFLETIDTDRNNVSPRLGVAWSPSASRRLVVRGSIGRFYDRVPLRALANALLSAGNTTDVAELRQTSVSLSPAQSNAPVFPNILSAVVPTTTLVNFTTMDRQLQNAYSNQVSLEVERQLGTATSVSVGYHRLRGEHLLMQINQNVPTCAASGSNNGCRPISAYANNNQYSAAGSSEYDGLHLSVMQRRGSWGSYRVSYTWSKSMNDLGETFFAAPLDPTDISKDWGRSDDDQRHRLTVSGSVTSPVQQPAGWWQAAMKGVQVSGMLQYYSALPFNITTGTTTIQGTSARPLVDGVAIPRNEGEASRFSTVSLRLSKQISLGSRASADVILEGFNVFNTRNDLARVGVFGTGPYPTSPAPNFGQVTVVGDPRSFQLGFRVRY
jgi:hypothetical protein